MHSPFVVWFKDIDTHPTSKIGKAGRHVGKLAQANFPILPGFVLTTDAYFAFLRENRLETKIKQLLTTMNYDRPESVHQVMGHIKKMISQTPYPEDVLDDLGRFYDALDGYTLTVQGHSMSNLGHTIASHTVSDFDEMADAVLSVWIQHFEPNIHWKRHIHGHDHLTTGVEILIQIAATPDKKGKIHTVDPHEHLKHVLTITHEHPHTWDTYVLSKKNLTIIDRTLRHHRSADKLDHEELLAIAELGKQVEQHLYFPQEITWGIIGNSLYMLKTKPISTLPKPKPVHKKKLAKARGIAITSTIGSGIVRIVADEKDLGKVRIHDIVIVKHIAKSHLPKLKKVRGIISETGTKHSEVAVLIHQLGIPTLIDVKNATKTFKQGQAITIHGGKAEIYLS